MKKTEKKKPIPTIPKGVWESSRPESEEKRQQKHFSSSTDLQGNGYPTNKQSE